MTLHAYPVSTMLGMLAQMLEILGQDGGTHCALDDAATSSELQRIDS